MILAVASGKGGTGKTTVSAALAAALAARGPSLLVDLDVEEPNAHLFFDVTWDQERLEHMPVPLVDEDRCTRCGACSDLCQFKAIAVLGQAIVTFDPMCHGCGGCWTICPEKCIAQGRRELGLVRLGRANDAPGLALASGLLRVGEAMSPPLMKRVMAAVQPPVQTVIDAPPGTSCPAMTATRQADAILLVSEPTPFGLYDLQLAVEAMEPMNKPMAVIINRHGLGQDRVSAFCAKKDLPVLARIPFDRAIAEGYSRGQRLEAAAPQWGPRLVRIFDWFVGQLAKGGAR